MGQVVINPNLHDQSKPPLHGYGGGERGIHGGSPGAIERNIKYGIVGAVILCGLAYAFSSYINAALNYAFGVAH